MNKAFLKSMIDNWPDATQKEALKRKFERIKDDSQEGLQDFLAMQPTGHIAIQMQNESGEYETVLEQPNLIVKGSEDILFRCFSGDGEHVLYKNRMPKNGVITLQLESSSFIQTTGSGLTEKTELTINPQLLWKEIAKNFEDQFDVTYGYDPKMVYIKKESSSTEFVQVIKIYTTEKVNEQTDKNVSKYATLMPEIYSTQTNLFMALGEGIARDQIHHSALVQSGDWDPILSGGYSTTDETATITVTQKVNFVKLTFGADENGGKWKVTVNGGTPQIIDSNTDEDQNLVLTNLLSQSQNANSTIVIQPDADGTTVLNPVWKLVGFEADFFEVNDNQLIQEFTNYTTKFLTARFYSTTTTPPFQIKLPHEGIKPETLLLKKGNVTFTSVNDLANVSNTAFHLDKEMGIITFGSIVSDIETTYEVTGQRHVHANTSGGFYRYGTMINSTAADNVKIGNKISITLPFVPTAVDGDFYVRGIDANSGNTLVFTKSADTTIGSYSYDATLRKIEIYYKDDSTTYEILEILAMPAQNAGYETNYRRGLLLKPKTGPEYPWYSLDDNKVTFIAEFGEFLSGVAVSDQRGRMINPVTIREMMLVSGPRTDDAIAGYQNWPNKAFSLIRIPETIKDPKTGMRILWTIQLSFTQG